MFHKFAKSLLRTAAITFPALFAAGAASAATTVNLTATRMTATLPDGTTVPMWGYCQPTSTVACVTDGTAKWAPGPTIVVATDATTGVGSLTVNFTNALPTATSLVIVGQIGGGLGTGGTGNDVPRVPSPIHAGQGATTWPAVDNSVQFTPPAQGARARAFAPETAKLSGTATYTWAKLRPGTYLYETGSVPSLQAPMGLYGVLVVTQAPTADTAGVAYPGINYDADATLLFSEIDPRQNAAVDAAGLVDADPTVLFSDASCSATSPCYPPAVNYAPTYFLINGQAYDPSAPQKSSFPLSDNKILTNGGQVLVRMLNAGLRTHVPSIVGLPNAGTMNLVAEDGNLAPGRHKAQTHLLLAAGKTYDVLVTPSSTGGVYDAASFAVFDRSLALTGGRLDTGSVTINSGMLGYIAVQSAAATASGTGGAPLPAALAPVANPDVYAVAPGASINGNVLTNDLNVVTAALGAAPTDGTLAFNADGSFTYTAGATTGTVTFTYSGNGGAVTGTVTINVGGTVTGTPVAVVDTFASRMSSFFKAAAPGVLSNDTSPGGLVLTPEVESAVGCTVTLAVDGAITAVPDAKGGACSFTYHVKNSMGVQSNSVTSTVVFPAGSGVAVTVQDTQDSSAAPLTDYSWVIEEDTTFFHDPSNPSATNTLAVNFHKSYMPVIASGCTGPISCGISNTGTGIVVRTPTLPSDVQLDPAKRYYISVLPGDADQGGASYNPDGTLSADATFGHTMGGVSIQPGSTAATVLVPRNPLPPAQLSVIVFEDNNPTNGGVDEGETGLGGFTVNLYDTRGSSGDPAGLMTYDLSGMPFTNSLANQIDSATGVNLCPMPTGKTSNKSGTIITCPELDSRRQPSPLAGMALIKNINPGRYDVWATPGADRAIKGENWIQVSTLEGTPANDTFIKPGEPAYWQEFGPPGFHSFIGFVNPDKVKATNARLRGTATITGRIPSLHMDRPTTLTAQGLNNSCASVNSGGPANANDPSCRATLAQTTCYVAVNSIGGTGANVAMATCDDYGNFKLEKVPVGQHSLVIWDQWLDQIIAQKAVNVDTAGQVVDAGDIPVFSWFTRIEQSAFIDVNQNGVRDDGEPGVSQIPMNIRFRDGSISNFLTTDSSGSVTANELFPLFNWYVIESDTTRYTGTGVHTVYDSGGKPDTAPIAVTDLNGNTVSKDFSGLLNSTETVSLPGKFQVPGAVYTTGKTSRIDPGTTLTEGTQGFINQTTHVDWGKRPYVPGENGGITGLVYYASTRGFDDPSLEVQFSWEPAIPRVKVNLYLETANADGTSSRSLVDQTTTWSWDDAAQQTHCPGDPATDGFVAVTLDGNNNPDNQFKCYDGQHSFNQIQPAVYDGRYKFPTAQCSICVPNPANNLPGKPATVTYAPVLPVGKYVVELVIPDGYEIVKEEDKNILIGDSWIAPAEATQFLGVGNLFIVPDQATLNDANVPGGNLMSAFPPCVGAMHRVPDFLTLFPDSGQISPYAGQDRPLCDHKEVQVTDQGQGGADFQLFTQTPVAGHISGIMLNDAAAEFDPYNPAFLEKASLPNAPISVRDYNGVEIARVYNDKWGTFNNLVPSTWEANIPNPSGYGPNMLTYCMNDPGPITDTRPTLADGSPNPNLGKLVTDPMYNPAFSNFCYVWPSMPGITTYLDTPVLPVSAYASASHYNPVDCAYPTGTPSIFRVDGTEVGPYINVAKATRTLTIQSLGDVDVPNPAYQGPQVVSPASAIQPKVTRHYGFGATTGTVTIGGVSVPVTSWDNTTITVSVPASGVATGELVVTTAAGVASIDTVTVTIENSAAAGYRAPVHVSPAPPSAAGTLAHPIQDAINAAQPGDLIILDAGSYPELVIMDRPVRLQGVGAAATIINATKYPNAKMDDWRTRINALFGLDNQGNTIAGTPAADPLPGQEITGGVLLLEPSVLSTEEGPGIAVVAKGYEADGTTLLNSSTSPASTRPRRAAGDCNAANPLRTHNFRCAASRIDGLSVTGGDAGGGIYVNGWAHNLEISNNRVYGNAGPLSGGVRIGQPYLEGQAITGNFTGFGYDENVKVHHNSITLNGTVEGNAAAGAVAAAAGGAGGGLSICAGSDGYKVTGNWVCGNYSSSDGGGIGHIGLSNNGLIQGNKILFNESFNQTGTQSGGGLVIEGEGATGTALSLGTGNVTVDGNVILGNFARAGGGGGIRLANVNGGELAANRTWHVTVTNNMITNNLAAWTGAGISMADTLYSTIVNNTIVSNDSTGIAGNLFNTMVNGTSTGATTAVPGPAGISSELTTQQLLNALPNAAARNANAFSKPTLTNNIVWHNRSFFFSMKSGTSQLLPSNNWTDATAATLPAPLGTPDADGCVASAEKYWDLGVVGETSAATTAFPAGTANVVSATAGTPNLVKKYCNGSIAMPGLQFEPGTPFQPPFNLSVAATLDESGNFVDLHFGPLSLTDLATGLIGNGDYHLVSGAAAASNAVDKGVANGAPSTDFDRDARPQGAGYDIGADEVAVPPALALVAPTSLAFADHLINTPATAQTLNVTITNNGATGSALLLSSIAIGGTNANQFSSTTTCVLGAPGLAAGSSCTVSVKFSPTSLGGKSGTLTVTDNSGNVLGTRQVVTLSGTGIRALPQGTITPSPVVMPTVAVGATSAPVTVTIQNTGTAALVFTGFSLVNGNNQFAIASNGCTLNGAGLAPAGSCQLTLTFSPTSAGSKTATLRIVDNSGGTAGTQQNVVVSGTTPVANASVSPATLDFGSVTRNTTSAAQAITVTNTGAANLVFTSFVFNGGSTTQFNVATGGTCVVGGAGVAPNGSCTINVTFRPNSAGAKNSTLRIADNSGGVSPQTVTVSGTGL